MLPKAIRMAVWNMHIGKNIAIAECPLCNKEISQQEFDCGHIISTYNGGNDDIANILPICGLCNKSMGRTNMSDYCVRYNIKSQYIADKIGICLPKTIITKDAAPDIKKYMKLFN